MQFLFELSPAVSPALLEELQVLVETNSPMGACVPFSITFGHPIESAPKTN